MMRIRTGLVASVLTVLSVSALSACSDSDASADGPGTTSKSPSAASEKKAPDPAADLNRAALTKSDVSGYRVSKPEQKYAFAKTRGEIKADKAACAPLAYAMNQFAPGSPQAELTRVASPGGKSVGAFTYVTLATYPDGAAKTTMAELTEAVGTCAGGFTAKAAKSSTLYDSVSSDGAPAQPGADQSTAFRATTKFNGTSHTVRTQVVRHGDTLAVYFAVDGMALAQGRSGDAKVAKAVVKAQSAKLS
ncbi:hypothetical protein [Streptomyces sp. NPDC058308]|uniref:hypothetical protein n=1 Tax=Streptomyces sp. NPDC058308 TaxID=3346440 RepID=UPI0036E1B019